MANSYGVTQLLSKFQPHLHAQQAPPLPPPPPPPPLPPPPTGFQQYNPQHNMMYSPMSYSHNGDEGGGKGGGGDGYHYGVGSHAYPSNSMQALLANQDAYEQGMGLVEDEEYNRLLKNYKLAHERIEEQRVQMLEQERQNAQLRKHIALLEGGEAGSASVVGSNLSRGGGGTTVDDFTIKNSSSGLERRINRWAADILASHAGRSKDAKDGTKTLDASSSSTKPHLALVPLAQAVFADLPSTLRSPFLRELSEVGFDYVGLGLVVQSLLRHLMSEMLCVGIVNKLLVTNSDEANQQLTLLHEQLFDQQPLVASVWRRQTFSAAVTFISLEMTMSLLESFLPNVLKLVTPHSDSDHHEQGKVPAEEPLSDSLREVIELSCTFSRMLHASKSPVTSGGPGGGGGGGGGGLGGGGAGGGVESSGFYRAFVPEIGSVLDPTRLELIKKCSRTERGEPERVGACLFPGLVKVSAIDTSPANPPLPPPVIVQFGVSVPVRAGGAGSGSVSGGRGHGTLSPIPSVQSGAGVSEWGTAIDSGIGMNSSRKSTTRQHHQHQYRQTRVLVVRRAQVICECALAAAVSYQEVR